MQEREKNIETTTTATRRTDDKIRDRDANRDPITGEPGSHPVGTGAGAAAGGAAGAAIGAVGGPVGALVGGAIGAVVGGAAGHGVAEKIDPTTEEAYWSKNFETRPYVEKGSTFDRYRPAYRYGWESRQQHGEGTWNEVEADLSRGWTAHRGTGSDLSWEQARPAARDAWSRTSSGGFDTTAETDFWRDHWRQSDYVKSDDVWDDYDPAYRYGIESRARHHGRRFEEVENDLERGWENVKGRSRLGWQRAKLAVRDAWHGIERRLPGDFDRDGR